MIDYDSGLARTVAGIIRDHEVTHVVDYTWGKEIVPHCVFCGYLGDKEDPALHTANVVLEYLETRGTTTTED